MRTLISLLFILLLPSIDAFAEGLPSYFSLPPNVKLKSINAAENFGEAEFRVPDKDSNIQRGHHWQADLGMEGVPEDISGTDIWTRIRPALLKGGWKVAGEFDENPMSATVHLSQGREAWASLTLFSSEDIRMDLVELAASKLSLKIPPPAAKPETIKPESGNFPFLPPLPGATFSSGNRTDEGFEVTLPGQEETFIVANGAVTKYYKAPSGVSNLEFVSVYRDALKTAGWTIIEEVQGINSADAVLTAHYAGNGRDIWANLHYGAEELAIKIADAGRQDEAKQLRAECRLTLTGVFFDFNQATLKPESDAALTRARDALKANSGLAIEVQGHTDAVGGDAYNQQLSESRAQSVAAWLAAHGIPAGQLTAKGYGKTKPVASNDTDEGRVKNRRVELVCRK